MFWKEDAVESAYVQEGSPILEKMDKPIPCLGGALQTEEKPEGEMGNKSPGTPCRIYTEGELGKPLLLTESFDQLSMSGSGPVGTEEEPHICLECGKSIAQHGKKPHQCPHCCKSFVKVLHFWRHLRIHKVENTFECCYCEMTFKKMGLLYIHERAHKGEKPYNCPDCTKSFSWEPNVKMHRRIHTGEKPFKCSNCGKSFHRKVHLVVHQVIHRGDKPYFLHTEKPSGHQEENQRFIGFSQSGTTDLESCV